MLEWANQFSICCFLTSNAYTSPYHSFDYLLAVGANQVFTPQTNWLSSFDGFVERIDDWIFGHISYDCKNETEGVSSYNDDHIGFPDICLFQPLIVIAIKDNKATISCLENIPEDILNNIRETTLPPAQRVTHSPAIYGRFTREEYIDTVNRIKAHIQRGDCYELNFCQEFYALNTLIDPLKTFKQLLQVSPVPFAAFYKHHDKYLLCTSPERYLKKEGNTILSQPIKGTMQRNREQTQADESLKQALYNSAKDRSENVMVVDLVRNDLSKICRENTVEVEELFGIYSFPQVHQMISTIKGTLKDNTSFASILKATFPMGSMTGAPKRKVLELIEKYERTKRGIFSGSIGYITPSKDFDFNVVIRSIAYNATKRYLNFQAGSAITFYADAETEYEECLLKVKAIKTVLDN